MKYYAYDKKGNVVRSGTLDFPCWHLYESADYELMEGFADPLVNYVLNGVLLEYTKEQQARRSSRPPFLCKWDVVTATWIDLRNLDDLKNYKWVEIKQARTQAEYAGFTWDGSVFDSDAISQQRITGAVTLAQLSGEFTISWTLQDNTVRQLGQADMISVGIALGLYTASQFAKAQRLRSRVDAVTDTDDLLSINW